MPKDEYSYGDPGLGAPSDEFEEITPHDTNELARLPKYLKVGATAGTVVMVDRNGNEITDYATAGQILLVRPSIIKATDTTASPINAYY